ncbi:MAG: DNA-processing protein DprA [Solirubrobacteraceae bacterium]
MSRGACDPCLRRTWLLGRMAGHLDHARARIAAVLELGEEELIAALGGDLGDDLMRDRRSADPGLLREHCCEAGLELLCRCDPAYPARLRDLSAPPAVLHVAGGLDRFLTLAARDPVAIVGSRAASPYGIGVARSLGGSLGRAGVTVLSGMAHGIDSAAHVGALDAQAPTIAVLPGPAERPYPAGRRALHRRVVANGAVVSELPPGTPVRRWMFVARNRIIAALAAMTVVVEAGERSGSLVTAGFAQRLGRRVGAVPGQITRPQAAGSNALLANRARVIRGPQDVLDALFGVGMRAAAADDRPELTEELGLLLAGLADGHGTSTALIRAGYEPEEGLAALASLELAGYVRREAGGRYAVIP